LKQIDNKIDEINNLFTDIPKQINSVEQFGTNIPWEDIKQFNELKQQYNDLQFDKDTLNLLETIANKLNTILNNLNKQINKLSKFYTLLKQFWFNKKKVSKIVNRLWEKYLFEFIKNWNNYQNLYDEIIRKNNNLWKYGFKINRVNISRKDFLNKEEETIATIKKGIDYLRNKKRLINATLVKKDKVDTLLDEINGLKDKIRKYYSGHISIDYTLVYDLDKDISNLEAVRNRLEKLYDKVYTIYLSDMAERRRRAQEEERRRRAQERRGGDSWWENNSWFNFWRSSGSNWWSSSSWSSSSWGSSWSSSGESSW